MHLTVIMVIGFLVVLGMGYAWVDLSRRRNPVPTSEIGGHSACSITPLDGVERHDIEQVADDLSHAVGNASHATAEGLGHCAAAITQVLSHH